MHWVIRRKLPIWTWATTLARCVKQPHRSCSPLECATQRTLGRADKFVVNFYEWCMKRCSGEVLGRVGIPAGEGEREDNLGGQGTHACRLMYLARIFRA